MSIDHVAKVLALGPEVSGTDRMVLLVLAEAANQDTDECWPGTATVAHRAGLRQERYVTKAVNTLVERGLLTVDPNGCPDLRVRADRRPNLYRLVGVMAVAHGGARRAGSLGHGGARRAATGVRDALFLPHIEPEVEPRAIETDLVSAGFDEFWAVYPHKVGKPSARRAWKAAVKRCDPATLIERARWYAANTVGTQPRFLKQAAGWLNDDRWATEHRPRRDGEYDEQEIIER